MELIREEFGNARGGEKVFLYTLRNQNGIIIKITNYGGIVTSIETPDKNGHKANIALGFKSLQEYISDSYVNNCPYFGCIVGRYANRIAKGQFSLNGYTYKLPINNGSNCLHGGIIGFDKVVWVPCEIVKPDMVAVELKYRSVDMEEGFPGNLDVSVIYTLNHKNEFMIEYKATTDKTTVVNFTNHTYFNLTGGKENIFNHKLQLSAQTYTEVDDLIPTGRIESVKGSPLDFTSPTEIGARINEFKDGYDHNFIIDGAKGKLVKAGVLSEESSGRMVEISTTEPAVQVYTGYYIPEMKGPDGINYCRYSGVTLESQHYADSPNHPEFPSTILNPGEVFKSKTIYKFGLIGN